MLQLRKCAGLLQLRTAALPLMSTGALTCWHKEQVGSPKRPALVYGEELLYPDFSVEIPRFLSEDDKAWWLQHLREDRPAAITERFMISGDRAYFRGQNGQNLVLRNVIFR